MKFIPQERLQQRAVERIVDVPVPHISKETVEKLVEAFHKSMCGITQLNKSGLGQLHRSRRNPSK